MRILIPVLLICMILPGLSGCALQSDVRILEGRLITLERQLKEFQRQIETTSEQDKARLRTQIETYGETLEEKEQSLRSQSASLQAMADRLRNEIQAVRGKLEETEFRLKQQTRAFEEYKQQTEAQLDRITGSAGSAYGVSSPPYGGNEPVPESEVPGNTPQGGTAGASLSAEELYTQGKTAFDKGDYNRSHNMFRMLVNQYPNAAYADNAQFWLGEIYYRQRQYENAILEYQTVIEKYPQGNKVRASLLKQGFSFANMGDGANARLILQELVDKHPGSSEARIARQKLDTL